MISTTLAALIGAAVGAIAMGTSAATTGHAPGLDIALQHLPQSTHGFDVVTTVAAAGAGAGGGGGIGAAVVKVAKSLARGGAPR